MTHGVKGDILIQEKPPKGPNITINVKMFENRYDLDAFVRESYTKGYLWEQDGVRVLTVMEADKKEG